MPDKEEQVPLEPQPDNTPPQRVSVSLSSDEPPPRTALPADYQGATPREVAAALLAYRPKRQRSEKKEGRE